MNQIQRRQNGTLLDSDAQVPAVPVQRVQTKYTTAMAVQAPRELTAVEGRSLQEAALLGSDAFYGWGAGKDRIEGPSKELAMALVRCYGNCAVDLGEVQETRDAWIFTATFVDLETGFTLARQFRQSKAWQVFGKFDDARKDDIRFQIGQSKAVRNVILNALPGWLVRRALDRAKGGVREAIEAYIAKNGMDKAIAFAMSRCEKCGAKPENVLYAMGRKNAASLTIEDLVILAGSVAILESGQDTVESVFPNPPAETAETPQGSKSEALVQKLIKTPTPVPTTPDPAAVAPADARGGASSATPDAGSGDMDELADALPGLGEKESPAARAARERRAK